MTSKQRAYLKSLAMVMDPIFQVGKNSVTPENIAAIGQALDKRELIKISVLQNCEDDAREIAECIAERTRSQVVQVIGKKIVLYKEGKDDKKKIELPKAKKMHKKIGILGGTFDPFHRGHFMLAETAYRQFSLDEVWILPNGNPPHKKEIEQTDFETRCEMICLAIEDTPSMKLCEVESSEDCYHYTYQTLMYLTEKHPDCRFFFIIGADSLNDFPTWKKPEIISKLCTLIVACRDEAGIAELERKSHEIEKIYGAECRILNSPKVDAASKEIRTMIVQDENAAPYLDKKVLEYIQDNNLYKN